MIVPAAAMESRLDQMGSGGLLTVTMLFNSNSSCDSRVRVCRHTS